MIQIMGELMKIVLVKKILLISMLLFSVCSNAQEELKFSKVIQSESGADKAELYTILRSFVSTYYLNSQKVIQMDDRDAGIIICKATSIFDSPSLILSAYEGWLDYNLKLQARDGRVRVEVSNFFHHNKPGNQKKAQLGVLTTSDVYTNSGIQKKFHNKVWVMLQEHAFQISNQIFNGVEEAIEQGVVGSQEEDW